MGVVQRQGIKSNLVGIIATMVGGLSILFVYPLDDDLYGYARWLYSTAFLMLPLAGWGIPIVVMKYYPLFKKSDTDDGGFFTFILGMYLLAYSVFLAVYGLFHQQIIGLLKTFDFKYQQILDNEVNLLVLGFFIGLTQILINLSANAKRIVIPHILENLGYKFFLPALFIATIYLSHDRTWFAYGIIGFYLVLAFLLIYYLYTLGQAKLRYVVLPKSNWSWKELGRFSAFSSLNSLGTLLTLNLDSVMIPLILTMTDNGIYTKLIFMASILAMPLRTITLITYPLIAEHWHKNEVAAIGKLYKQSSNNLFFVGGLFFLVIHFCLPYLVELSGRPESFEGYYWLFILLGLGKLIDMITSINSGIMMNSIWYRYHLYFLLLLAAVNIYLNYELIQSNGILGAAQATLVALLIHNLMKVAFIYFKVGIQPFETANLKTLILGCGLFYVFSFINLDFHPIWSIGLTGSMVGLVYVSLGYLWKVSPEINTVIDKTLNQLITFK